MLTVKKFILVLFVCFVGFSISEASEYQVQGLVRAYYLNDQRIQWSGMETTFATEAIINPVIEKGFTWGKTKIEGEFKLNQPYGKNILKDENTDKYRANFETEFFGVSQLYLQIQKDNFSVKIGKSKTPFGKVYFPVFTNSYLDAPFIRTDAILWRETGLFFNYKQGLLVCDLAVVNGEENKDTNSGKAIIGRIGIEDKNWAAGISVKTQDGIGSETQKTFKNHAGIDFMLHFSHFTLSSEIIYDEYGFRQDYQDDVFWPQGFYYRNTFYKDKTPITGIGGYLDLTYQKENWLINLNYGEYHPKKIGKPYHDDPIKRGIIKTAYSITQELQPFIVVLMENNRKTEEWKSEASGVVVILGLQYKF